MDLAINEYVNKRNGWINERNGWMNETNEWTVEHANGLIRDWNEIKALIESDWLKNDLIW